MQQLTQVTHAMVTKTKKMVLDTSEIRDHIADFDDFFRPIATTSWEPHCFDIPVCWRSDRCSTLWTGSTFPE